MKAKTSCTPKAAVRAQAQRERILAAALTCFVEHGFHAASMASISEAAQMSPGLIYRYFENKNAIILAIIERQLEEKRADIAALQSETELAPKIIDLFTRWQQDDPGVMSATLSFEMTAQARRDPQVADAVRTADRTSRSDFSDWIWRRHQHAGAELTQEQAQCRAFLVQCIVEGLAVRATREPDLDQDMLNNSLEFLLPLLLPRGNAD